jgi:uncharacterized protein with PQ loop repeat
MLIIKMPETLFWTISLNVANVVGFVYSIPQMIRTWKTKSTRDIDTTGQVLRCLCSVLWITYCIRFRMIDIGVSWGVTLLSSAWILGFKAVYEYHLFQKKYIPQQSPEEDL